MTEAEKATKFDAIQKRLWAMAVYGNTLQSAIASALIRDLDIIGLDGEDPESA